MAQGYRITNGTDKMAQPTNEAILTINVWMDRKPLVQEVKRLARHLAADLCHGRQLMKTEGDQEVAVIKEMYLTPAPGDQNGRPNYVDLRGAPAHTQAAIIFAGPYAGQFVDIAQRCHSPIIQMARYDVKEYPSQIALARPVRRFAAAFPSNFVNQISDDLTRRIGADIGDDLQLPASLLDAAADAKRRSPVSFQERKSKRQTPKTDQINEHYASGYDYYARPFDSYNPRTPMNFQLKHSGGGVTLHVYQADLTEVFVDTIVNPANERLRHMSGAAQAIADAAGPEMARECQVIIEKDGPLRTSYCVVTGPGLLPRCRRVIHAVGPRWDPVIPDRCRELLRKTYKSMIHCAYRERTRSLATTLISSGQFGMPRIWAVEELVGALRRYLQPSAGGMGAPPLALHLVDTDVAKVTAIRDRLSTEAEKNHWLAIDPRPPKRL